MKKIAGRLMVVSSFAIPMCTLFMLAAYEYDMMRELSLNCFLVSFIVGMISVVLLTIYDFKDI